LLDVRNDGWTIEHIKHYMNFLKYVLNFTFEKFNYNEKEYLTNFFGNSGDNPVDNMNLFNN
jgi:hypothetical protein